jgi:putative hemolysin
VISVERSFYEKFPRLSAGAGRAWSQPLVNLLRKLACEARINDTLERLQAARGFEFVDQALALFRFDYRVAPTDREHIPSEGRAVIVANHPLGALDALALLHLVGSVRRDVKILANDVLMQFEPLRPLLLGCDVFGAGTASSGLREAYRALDREEALIVFPAGEVSRIRPDGIRDRRWSTGFLRFALKRGAPVVPVHVAAHNSPMFYGLSMLARPLATLMLPREMFAAQQARIGLTVGAPVAVAALQPVGLSERRVAALMRRHVYRLARRKPPVFATTVTVAHPEAPQAVRQALRRAERLGQTGDGKQILLLDAEPGCVALREIGRLRELAFRRVGEGTGLKRDLDRYDAWYRHIVLWDEQALEIVGAYRLGDAARILAERGRDGLYSASLFDYSPAANEFLGHAVELGRSFVHPRHWGGRSLDYLWQGIGAYLRRHPQVRYLFGPVSLSAQLPETERAWIVHCHQHYFADTEGLARARNPFRVPTPVAVQAAALWEGMDVRQGLSRLRDRLGSNACTIPTLYRQYVELCEEDGIRFLDFGIDPGFGHCVDGLIRVDLARLKPAKRARYLGQTPASVPA